MRKWVVAGMALVVIGVVGYFLDRPRMGNVEYHKKQFLKENKVWSKRPDRWIMAYSPRFVAEFYVARRVKRAKFHKDALIKLGYLEEREFVFSNRSAMNWWNDPDEKREVRSHWWNAPDGKHDVGSEFTDVLSVTTNTVTVLTPREDMAEWEKLIREADVPKK